MMLSREKILMLFEKVNDSLAKKNEIGEIGLIGGAVMCLVFKARPATKDVDAVFEPSSVLRRIVTDIADEEGLPPDWLNDAAKGFLTPNFQKVEVLSHSHLRVWAPEPRYMLAMKCISARWDTSDKDDVEFLIKYLKLKKAKDIFLIIEQYYPKNIIPPKTQFFLEELMDNL